MKSFISLFSISLFLLILWRCNPWFERKEEKAVPVSTVRRDLETEKENLARHLRDCSNDLDRRIRALDDQIKVADDSVRKSLNELRGRLVREKEKVDRSLKDIQRSSDASWKKTKKKATEVFTDAKIETQKIEERVEDLID